MTVMQFHINDVNRQGTVSINDGQAALTIITRPLAVSPDQTQAQQKEYLKAEAIAHLQRAIAVIHAY